MITDKASFINRAKEYLGDNNNGDPRWTDSMLEVFYQFTLDHLYLLNPDIVSKYDHKVVKDGSDTVVFDHKIISIESVNGEPVDEIKKISYRFNSCNNNKVSTYWIENDGRTVHFNTRLPNHANIKYRYFDYDIDIPQWAYPIAFNIFISYALGQELNAESEALAKDRMNYAGELFKLYQMRFISNVIKG